jgi:hypothetical protein
MGMVRIPALLTLALLAFAAPASASIGGYDATDGILDVAGTTKNDATLGGDDVLGGGSKELEPRKWVVEPNGSSTGKADFASFGYAVTETADDSFLYLHFDLVGDTGNVHAGFEIHQTRATFVTQSGDSVSCRTDGDVMIAYDGSEDAVDVAVYRWEGSGGPESCPDGAVGSWIGGDAGATAEGKLVGTFGEAAVNLGELADLVNVPAPCEYFTSISAHSRNSGSSEDAQLGDIVTPLNLSVAACKDPGGGGDTTPPADPAFDAGAGAGCNADGTVTLTGTASLDTALVQLREGTAGRGQTVPAADGSWSITLEDVPTGSHTYGARAFDSSNNVSGSATVDVEVDATAPALTVTTAAGGPGEVRFAGTSEPGATVTVLEGDVVIATLTAGSDGKWATTVGAAAGDHVYVVRAADTCGNVTTAGGSTGDADGDGKDGIAVNVTPAQSGNLGETPQGPGPGTGVDGNPDDGNVGGECATKPFQVLISKDEKRVKRVTFLVDGRKVKSVRKRDAQGRFTAKIDPSKFKPGTHQVVAKLKLRNGKTRKVKHRSFTVCGVGKCTSRLRFWMPIRRVMGDPYAKASATVAGKKAKVTRRGGRLGVQVNLVGKPKGAYKVRVRAVTESGRAVTRTRTIRTCGLKKKP